MITQAHYSSNFTGFHYLLAFFTNTIVLLSLLSALTLSPSYLSDRLHLHRSCRSLRSSEDTLILTVPKFSCKTSRRLLILLYAISSNSLPSDIRYAKTLDKVNSNLKYCLFIVHLTEQHPIIFLYHLLVAGRARAWWWWWWWCVLY